MECECIDANVDEYSTVISDKIHVARKEHRCGECDRSIQLGEKYRNEVTIYDGRFDINKTCIDCDSVREHLVCSFYLGEVWSLVEENLSEYGKDQPWAAIGRLTPAARERVCKIIEYAWEDQEDEGWEHARHSNVPK